MVLSISSNTTTHFYCKTDWQKSVSKKPTTEKCVLPSCFKEISQSHVSAATIVPDLVMDAYPQRKNIIDDSNKTRVNGDGDMQDFFNLQNFTKMQTVVFILFFAIISFWVPGKFYHGFNTLLSIENVFWR